MVEVKGAYKYGRYETFGIKKKIEKFACNIKVFATQDGWTADRSDG